jgi:glucose/arabinose dehydrogenase
LRYLVIIMLSLWLVAPVLARQDAASPQVPSECLSRATGREEPWIKAGSACLEEVINDPSAGELAFTALAVAPDGTLYAARPLAGEVLALTDTNGDLLPDTPQIVAEGLTLPNGLDYYDGALYISGGARVYRLQGGELETLVDDLPSGDGGFWTGGIAVSDGRIYVATGAPCDFCAPDDSARGAILSYALDGTDRQIVATGLRQPADLAFQRSDLYVLDSARDGLFDTPDLDELNRVEQGANFGFPYCVGSTNTPDMPGDFDCANATPPLVAFPTASTPLGIAAYRGETIPALEGKLLVVLNGSYNDLSLRGYWVAIVDPVARTIESLMPTRPDAFVGSDFTVEQMNYRGSGFFPHRPLDVAVTEQGWVYISVGGGRILALRD